MPQKRLNTHDMNMQAVTALAGQIIGMLLDTQGLQEDGSPSALPWNEAVFGATMAIKSFSFIAMEIERLSAEEARDATKTAMLSALRTKIVPMPCSSVEELDEMHAAMQAPKGARH
jgi:hypothetical protein